MPTDRYFLFSSPAPSASVDHSRMANAIRALSMDTVEKAKSGHPGLPMGMADVATVLFTKYLRFTPRHPEWPNRDRFILSAGHGSMLLYSLLYLTGYPDMTLAELESFRQLGSRAAGHPELGHASGIETTTGPLGQGLGNAVGMALAEKLLAQRYGEELVDHYTYVVAGDGCLMEGISQEAISFAGHLNLSKLIVLFDDNQVSIDGPTSLSVSDDQLMRFEACNWHVQSIDGHNPEAITLALDIARSTDQPSLIACRTTIGYGAPTKGGTSAAHGAPLGAEEITKAREALDWPYWPFYVPEDILAAWREVSSRHEEAYQNWCQELNRLPEAQREQFESAIKGSLGTAWKAAAQELKSRFLKELPTLATRQSSQKVLDCLVPHLPNMIGGSADLTASNNTRALSMAPISREDFSGNYIYYGVREHAMAAIMNGIALHKGFIPYGGTFLAFSDYSRPAIRLAALMKQRVIFVMTHDSIGLGEDGPTHQPIEHLAALRAIPHLNVFRPTF